MTTEQIEFGTRRLDEMERRNMLPAETLRDLRAWWRSVEYREAHKVVSLDEYRVRRAYLP